MKSEENLGVCSALGLVLVHPPSKKTDSNFGLDEGLVSLSQVSCNENVGDISDGKEVVHVAMETENDSSSDIVDLDEKDQEACKKSRRSTEMTSEEQKVSEKECNFNFRKSLYSPTIKSWKQISSRKRKNQVDTKEELKSLDKGVNNDLFNIWKTHDYCQQTNKTFTTEMDGKAVTLQVVSPSQSSFKVKVKYGEKLQTQFLENIQDSLDRLT